MKNGSLADRPIRLVVGASASSAGGLLARVLAPALATQLGQPVNIEFHQGENNTLGASLVADSPPDGSVLLLTSLGMLAGVLAIRSSRHAAPVCVAANNLSPVALVARCPMLLAVHPSVPAHTISELTDIARAQPGKLTFASSLIAGAPHIAAELYMKMAGVDMTHVCYRDTQQLYADFIDGHLSLSFNNIMLMLAPLSRGKLRGLAVTSATRSSALPHLPTFAESGLSGYEITNWFGIVAPARATPGIIAALNAGVVAALQSRDVMQNLAAYGMEAAGSTAPEFGRYISDESEKWAPWVKQCTARNTILS